MNMSEALDGHSEKEGRMTYSCRVSGWKCGASNWTAFRVDGQGPCAVKRKARPLSVL